METNKQRIKFKRGKKPKEKKSTARPYCGFQVFAKFWNMTWVFSYYLHWKRFIYERIVKVVLPFCYFKYSNQLNDKKIIANKWPDDLQCDILNNRADVPKFSISDTHMEELVLYWKNSLKYKVGRFWRFSYVYTSN